PPASCPVGEPDVLTPVCFPYLLGSAGRRSGVPCDGIPNGRLPDPEALLECVRAVPLCALQYVGIAQHEGREIICGMIPVVLARPCAAIIAHLVRAIAVDSPLNENRS